MKHGQRQMDNCTGEANEQRTSNAGRVFHWSSKRRWRHMLYNGWTMAKQRKRIHDAGAQKAIWRKLPYTSHISRASPWALGIGNSSGSCKTATKMERLHTTHEHHMMSTIVIYTILGCIYNWNISNDINYKIANRHNISKLLLGWTKLGWTLRSRWSDSLY